MRAARPENELMASRLIKIEITTLDANVRIR